MFFCFWETNLCLGYSQKSNFWVFKLKSHFWMRCSFLGPLSALLVMSISGHPLNIYKSSGLICVLLLLFICSLCVHIYSSIEIVVFSLTLSWFCGGMGMDFRSTTCKFKRIWCSLETKENLHGKNLKWNISYITWTLKLPQLSACDSTNF